MCGTSTQKSGVFSRMQLRIRKCQLADRNQNPKRCVWKAKGEDILRKVQQAWQTLAQQTVTA